MDKLLEFKVNLAELNNFAISLSDKAKIGDIFLLEGDLGAGKTTFSRFFINSQFDKYQLKKPQFIKSPSFPILNSYPLTKYEINHYDLFRINNSNEINELELIENLDRNITLIEWPKILINNYLIKKYFLINIKIINLEKRLIKIKYLKIK